MCNITIIRILVANLIPVFGILFLDWELFFTFFYFWFENIITGVFFVIIGIISKLKISSILSFVFFYSFFAFFHGIFIFALFGNNLPNQPTFPSGLSSVIKQHNLTISLIILFTTYCGTFIWRYILNNDARKITIQEFWDRPLVRMTILHVSTLLGGFILKLLGSPVLGISILVIFKFFYDLDKEKKYAMAT